MAYDFSGTSQYAYRDSTPVTAAPLTIALWFNLDLLTNLNTLISIGVGGATNNRFSLEARGDVVGDPVRFTCNDGSNSALDTTVGYSTGTWQHACGVASDDTNRAIYLDGANKQTQAVARTPTGLNRVTIGGLPNFSGLTNGRIAEVGIWSAALDDAEVAALAKGYSPLLIRTASLECYAPIIGRNSVIRDFCDGSFTINGALTASDHCRVFRPKHKQVSVAAAAAATTQRRFMLLGMGQ